jgi:tetratricopeptide (TPR) repeat protein
MTAARHLGTLLALAKALIALDDEAADVTGTSGRLSLPSIVPTALEFAAALNGDLRRFAELSVLLGKARLTERVLDLPSRLALSNHTEAAVAVAQAFEFVAPDKLRGDRAVALARASRRDEAMALVTTNLERAEDVVLAEAKAGDVYRALGEDDAAEAYYRRSLAEAKTPFERSEAVLRIVSLMSDADREQDAARFLAEERKRAAKP